MQEEEEEEGESVGGGYIQRDNHLQIMS